MLATVAAADSAKVQKKSTAFLYIAKWNHTLCTLYINRRVNCVFSISCVLCLPVGVSRDVGTSPFRFVKQKIVSKKGGVHDSPGTARQITSLKQRLTTLQQQVSMV